MFNLFVKSYKGEASLAKAFWLIYVLFSMILSLVILGAFFIFIPDFSNTLQANEEWYQSLIQVIQLPYLIFAAIAVWRCAKNSWIVWNILARVLIVLTVLGSFYEIYRLCVAR